MTRFVFTAALMICLCGITAQAQAKFHVFPQIADGVASDGSYYKSTFMILPWIDNTAPNCSLTFYGMSVGLSGVSGNFSSFTITIPSGGYYTATTAAAQALRSGYATLTCSEYVFAQVLYGLYDRNGFKLAEATVFSASENTTAKMILDHRDGAALGLAIANNTDSTHTYILTFATRTATFQVPARSTVAKFVDQFMSMPAGSLGILKIDSTDSSNFSAIGLRFTGGVFTTIPAN